MITRVTVQVVGRQKGGGRGLATGEAQLALASLGQSPHEEGGGQVWLLTCVGAIGPRLGLT